jgi:anti-sigma B factor antagonist
MFNGQIRNEAGHGFVAEQQGCLKRKGDVIMNIETVFNDSEVVLNISGRLDTTTAPRLETGFMKIEATCKSLILDLAKLEYISSAGLRVLLKMQKTMAAKSGMKLLHVNETVMEVFEITGFSDILNIV